MLLGAVSINTTNRSVQSPSPSPTCCLVTTYHVLFTTYHVLFISSDIGATSRISQAGTSSNHYSGHAYKKGPTSKKRTRPWSRATEPVATAPASERAEEPGPVLTERWQPCESESEPEQEENTGQVDVSLSACEFQGGRLTLFLPQWETLTSDPDILQTAKGYKIDFESEPVQFSVPMEQIYPPRRLTP